VPYHQGYLTSQPGRTVRVRVAGDQGWLTIKGPSEGVSRAEYEYPVPVADALEMLDTLCERPQIEKTRYLVPFAGNTWEVDEFHGDNEGLVVAELELDSADQRFESPPWLGREVSDDVRYFNSHLARHPYSRWKNA
jgi:CYTH domain-containing protein